METIRSKHNLPPLRLAPLVPPPAQDVPHQVDPPLNHYFKEQSNLQQRFLQNEPPASPFVFFNNEVPPSPFHPNRSVYTQPTPQSNPYSQQLQQQPYPSPQTPNFPQYQSTSYQQLDSSHSPVIINSQFNQSNIIYNHNHNHYPQIQNSNLNASTSQFQLRRGAGAQTNNQVYNPELLGPIPTSSARVWNWDANQRNLIEPSNHRVNDGNSSSYWNRVENSNIQPYFNQPSEAFDSNTSQLEFHSKPVPSVSASASTSTSTSTPTISANQTRRPFIEKLSHILEAVATTVDESGAEIIYTNCYSDTISFDQTGEYILVLSEKGGRLENEILPHWFSHKSTAAFSRQMNVGLILLLLFSRNLSNFFPLVRFVDHIVILLFSLLTFLP